MKIEVKLVEAEIVEMKMDQVVEIMEVVIEMVEVREMVRWYRKWWK